LTKLPALYQAFATSGENEPSGDEKFFSLARQARCIPIVATQSISSLRTVLPGESWRTLLQGLRTKIFLTLSDDFSARVAADLCGKAERLKPGYLDRAGQDARVSLLTGRPAAQKATVARSRPTPCSSTTCSAEDLRQAPERAGGARLRRANPSPTSHLKPHYLNVQTSYFDHLAPEISDMSFELVLPSSARSPI
jgi:hypothetical protein